MTQTTIAEAIRSAAERLAATSDTARLDAEVLMAHALGATRSDLLLRHMRDPAPAGFAALVDRRALHEPVAYITGRQEFFGLELEVGPAVLIPRGDSECVVEAALVAMPQPRRVLDLGTGSGALLLAALDACPDATGVGLDASAPALAVAERNAGRTGLGPRCTFVLRDWHAAGWAEGLGRFDLVLCNPPYVEADAALESSVHRFEPASALFAGADGLDEYRVLMSQVADLLAPNGLAAFEIGAEQADAAARLAAENGLASTLRHDLAGRPRALLINSPA